MYLSDNARRIMDLRYSRKDEDGNPTESPEEVVQRVAENVALATHNYDNTDAQLNKVTERYRKLLDERLFFPNSPTWTGAGTPLGQLSACFVLPVEDDLGRTRASIFETLKVAALIQQTGGGNGFDFSSLRPNKATISRSMGQASGPVGFMEAYNGAFQIIAQGGSRRGANMGVLKISHPDIRRFIKAKTEEGKIEEFNISVAITDEFMEAVKAQETFELVHNGRVYETVDAVELFESIAQDAWKFGDPGLLFIDEANRFNPCPYRYTYEATNPCGEQWLPPYGSCNLGSIALQRFVDTGVVDWKGLAKCITQSVQFLDDVIDANAYVDEVPELEATAQGERRIGLGYMGMADAMAKLKIRYGSPQGESFVAMVTEFLRFHAMQASIQRAKERGPFEWIEGSIYDPLLHRKFGAGAKVDEKLTLWKAPMFNIPDAMPYLDMPSLPWHKIEEGVLSHGIRNACLLTMAPTGTISNVADCEGSGCEPFFAIVFERKVMQEGENIVLKYASDLFAEALVFDEGLNDQEVRRVIAEVAANGGSCQNVAGISQSTKDAFVTAGDLTAEEHIRMQAATQQWVDNSISKTINMPNEATVEDVKQAYLLAYRLKAKGITIYRQGSRVLEVLSTKKAEVPYDVAKDLQGAYLITGELVSDPNAWPVIRPMPIPESAVIDGLPTRTYPVQTGFGTLQVYITEHPDHPGRPFDCRISIGKHGSDKNADVEALARMISISLRSGVSVEAVVDQLKGIGGRTAHGFGPNKVLSVADGVGKLLERLYISSDILDSIEQNAGIVDPSRTCPECHNASLVFESGCFHCDTRYGGCGNFSGCD